MKRIISENVTPEFLSQLDKSTNIIICTGNNNYSISEAVEGSDIFSIKTQLDVNLSQCNPISQHVMRHIFHPIIKISVPVGIKWVFTDPETSELGDVFIKSFKTYKTFDSCEDKTNIVKNVLLTDLAISSYIDTIHLRNKTQQPIIKTPMVNLYFSWYIQTKTPVPNIDEIYLIESNDVYEHFIEYM